MKKKSSILLLLMIILFVVSCGDNNPPEETNEFKVTFMNEEGELLKVITYEEGDIPSYTYNPSDTTEFEVSFKGWSLTLGGEVVTLSVVTKDITYYAVVSKTPIVVDPNIYTLTFNSNGGTSLEPAQSNENDLIEEPTKPVKEGYKFVSWSYDQEGNDKVTWPITLTKDITIYANYNELIDLKTYLKDLLDGYNKNPYSYIPETLLPEAYLVSDPNTILYKEDYQNNVNINNINYLATGEQWNMVVENLGESQRFYNVLNTVELINSAAIAAFNNYFDNNPSDENSFTFKESIYDVYINFEDNVLSYTLTFTTNIPILGELEVVIDIKEDIITKVKTVKISLGSANQLKYEIKDNEYIFAIKYGGIRRAYFSIKEENGVINGNIFEFLTIASKDFQSSAQFVINDENLIVVGNKADGIIGFTSTINEVYDIETGLMVGYEIEETLSKIVYNTLWFDLNNFSGLNNIKYLLNDKEEVIIHIDNQLFETKNVGGFNLKTGSRRYDIKFRTRYIYKLEDDQLTKVKIDIPMLFIQEEVYDDLVKDIKEKNSHLNDFDNNVSNETFNIIKESYSINIPIFKQNKENISSEDIVNYIDN